MVTLDRQTLVKSTSPKKTKISSSGPRHAQVQQNHRRFLRRNTQRSPAAFLVKSADPAAAVAHVRCSKQHVLCRRSCILEREHPPAGPEATQITDAIIQQVMEYRPNYTPEEFLSLRG